MASWLPEDHLAWFVISVVEGMDVVDKIKAVKTASKGGHDDVPVEDVVIKSVRRVAEEKK